MLTHCRRNSLYLVIKTYTSYRLFSRSSISLIDGIDILKDEHNEVRSLIEEYRICYHKTRKNEIITQLIQKVKSHTVVEEEYVYPLIKKKFETGRLLYDKDLLDDQINNDMFKFLMNHKLDHYTNEQDDEVYNRVVEKFFNVLSEHINDEEFNLFPKLRDRLSLKELDELGEKIERKRMHEKVKYYQVPSTIDLALE